MRKVLEGKDGWLFLDNDTNAVVAQQTGEVTLTPAQLTLWQRTLELRHAWAASRGLKYVFLIAPDTHATYPEFLPDHVVPSQNRPVFQLLEHLKKVGCPLPIYPIDQIKEAKANGLVAQQTDSHWSNYGAFVAYKALMERVAGELTVPVLSDDDVTIVPIEAEGDLGSKMDPVRQGAAAACRLKKAKAKVTFRNDAVNRGHVIVTDNEDTSLPKALVFRDSFGVFLVAYISESFSHVKYVTTPLFEFDLIEEEKPDIVISLMAERFIVSVPDDLHAETSTALALRRTGAPSGS